MNLPSILLLATSIFASTAHAQRTPIDPCVCKNVEISISEETVLTTTQQGPGGLMQLIFVASMRKTITRDDGRCDKGQCQRPRECQSTIDGSVTVHSDSALLGEIGSNALMVDGAPISSASGPTPVQDSKTTDCGGIMRPRIEASSPIDNSAVLFVELQDRCQSCLGIAVPSGTGGGGSSTGG